MNIEKIIKNKVFAEFRQIQLFHNEIDRLIELLNSSNEINWFIPFLNVREDLPIELLKPIILTGIRYEDVSKPKHWMPDLIRIYSQEKIDEVLFELIDQSSLDNKCKLTNLFYWNSISFIKSGNQELGIKWFWDGECYEEEYVEVDIVELKARFEKIRNARLTFMIKEFTETCNLIYRYFIALNLPWSIDKYPEKIKESANEVIEIINKDNFPVSADSLIEQVQGDVELEKTLFIELGWQN